MIPYYNTMDGPVVKASELALEMENVNYVLPFVKKENEKELKDAFEKTISIRELSEDAADVADFWFFETAVRLYNKGKKQCYDGIKPADIDWGPIIQRAEKALEEEDLTDLLEFISAALERELRSRFNHVLDRTGYELNDVEEARDYSESMLEFVLYANYTYNHITGQKRVI